MPKKLTFTKDELKAYFYGHVKGPFYDLAVKQANRLLVHADGVFPGELITERRPNEDPAVQAYREKIFKAKTRPAMNKIFNSLSKIRRSGDYQVNYPKEEFPRIPEGERLADYCEGNFPFFTSVTNWVFSVLLKHYLVDPNAVVFVRPLEQPENDADFVRPYPELFSSANVIEFRDEDYCILRDPAGALFQEGERYYNGERFYVVTTQSITRYDQVNGKSEDRFAPVFYMEHGLGFLPAYQLKAVVKAAGAGAFLYESRIDPVVEEFDEAVREYSDLQGGKVMHMHPERWEITTKDCPNCENGNRPPTTPGGQPTKCETCAGQGKISAAGPYGKLLISRSALDAGNTMPIPPAGFVQKDVEVLRLMDEGVDKHLYKALSTINMQFLDDTPLSESGYAKEVDRDETTNFVHSIAEDLIRIKDWLYLTIASWRYKVQYPSPEDIKRMVPKIPVPQSFDLFSMRYAEQDIKNAKESGINPVIIAAMQLSYAAKKFNAEPELRDQLQLVFALDPFHSVPEEDKTARLQNDSIRKVDYIISANIQQFVKRALIADPQFAAKTYEQQRQALEAFAQVIIDEHSAARQVQNALPPDGTEEEAEGAENVETMGENGAENGLNGE